MTAEREPPREDEPRWAVLAFVRLLAEEEANGSTRTLEEYLGLFPEDRDGVLREYMAHFAFRPASRMRTGGTTIPEPDPPRPRRRTSRWVAVTVGLVLVAGAVSVVQLQRVRRAEAESRALAEALAARSVVRTLSDRLPRHWRTSVADATTLAATLDLIDSELASQSDTWKKDPEAARLAIATWLEVARLRWSRFSPHLGDLPGARRAVEQAYLLCTMGTVLFGTGWIGPTTMAEVFLEDALLSAQEEHPEQARQLLEGTGPTIDEEPLQIPAPLARRLLIARSELRSSQGAARAALQDVEAAIAIPDSGGPEFLFDRVLTLRARGLAHAADGKYAEAIAAHRNAIAIAEIGSGDPDRNVSLEIATIQCASELGHWLRLFGDLAGARREFSRAADSADDLATPGNTSLPLVTTAAGLHHSLALVHLLDGRRDEARLEVAAVTRLLERIATPTKGGDVVTLLRLSTVVLRSQCESGTQDSALLDELRSALVELERRRAALPNDVTWFRLEQEVGTETVMRTSLAGDDDAANGLAARLETAGREFAARTKETSHVETNIGRRELRLATVLSLRGKVSEASRVFRQAIDRFEQIVRAGTPTSLDLVAHCEALHGAFLCAMRLELTDVAEKYAKRFEVAFGTLPLPMRTLPRLLRLLGKIRTLEAKKRNAAGDHAAAAEVLRGVVALTAGVDATEPDPELRMAAIELRLWLAATLRECDPPAAAVELVTVRSMLEDLLAAHPAHRDASAALVRTLVTMRIGSKGTTERGQYSRRLIAVLEAAEQHGTASAKELAFLAEELLGEAPSVEGSRERARDLARSLMARPEIGPQPALLDIEARALLALGDGAAALAAASKGLELLGERGSAALRASLVDTIARAEKRGR